MQNIKENLAKLCTAIGVAGYEKSASNVALKLLFDFDKNAYIDDFSNVIGFIKSKKENAKTILLDAHIDEIGMIVTAIDKKGFLRVSKCGGVDLRILAAQEVVVHTKSCDLIGIIGAKPPHLEKGDEAKKIPDIEDVFIDIGLNKEQADLKVSQGDRVTIFSRFNSLLNDKVSCKCLDDRAGVCGILQALNQIKDKEINYNVAVVFSSQEETGSAGAKISTYKICPDEAIVVDVSFAKVSDENEYKCGKMGDGVMIGFASSLDFSMSNKMKEIAKAKNIPFQIEVMGSSTGTNADEIGVSKQGVRAVTLSIPQAYMHTPIEVCKISDIQAVADLITEYLMD